MGEVWLGKRTAMGTAAKAVAVKLLTTTNTTSRDNFIKEAKLAMLLRHSTIVQVNDVGESQGTCFMEMEWVDGFDLSRLNDHLRSTDEKLSVEIAAYVIGELLKALAYAHALEIDGKRETIVHRDVTPQNVLISKSGEVKLTDFGIAFMTSDKTSSDMIKGKSRYMAPEHVRQVREPCIDIYGVGAIFHEMVDGQKFRHTAESDVDLLNMAFGGIVPPLSIELPAELEALRQGLLATDLTARFPTARAALAALRKWPGYRDTSEELEELIRAAAATADVPLPATEQLPAVSNGRNELTGEGSGKASRTDASDTEVSNSRTGRSVAVPVQPPRVANRVASVGLALIALGFAGFGAAAVIEQMGGEETASEEQVEPQVATNEDETKPVEPPPSPTSEAVTPATAAPVPEPIPTEPPPPPVDPPPPSEPLDVPKSAPPPAEDVAKPPVTETEKKPEKKAKSEVMLEASGYPWVRLRIDGTIYELDRKKGAKKVLLKPGKHSAAFQIDEEASWTDLGKLDIPAKPKVTVDLRKPGKLVLQ